MLAICFVTGHFGSTDRVLPVVSLNRLVVAHLLKGLKALSVHTGGCVHMVATVGQMLIGETQRSKVCNTDIDKCSGQRAVQTPDLL